MLGSIEALPQQCLKAWEETQQINILQDYRGVENIVVSGMGGSALGAEIIKSLYNQVLPPLEIIRDYHLPGYVNEKTLVILSSYSGNTEETLTCAKEAKAKEAKILGITTGGKLGEFLGENSLPGYIFDPKFNPCGQPRIGLGYSIIGQVGLLAAAGLLQIDRNEFFQCFKSLKVIQKRVENQAKEKVKDSLNKIITVVGAQHLAGNAHILANQINENAKTLSFYFLLPELNHHLLEGLKNPQDKKLGFLFLNSACYRRPIKKLFELTKEVVQKNGVPVFEFKPEASDKFLEVLETLWFGSFLSFYLAMSYRLDPSPIPWVDYFKERRSQYGE